ncbi:MAG: ABC transporter permease [Thermomicrobiales bacterium]
MLVFAARRMAQFLPTLALVSVVVFVMVRAIPGNPADVLLGPQATEVQAEALADDMGLDEPVWVQYGWWLGDILRGDFGRSWINDFPVATLIESKLAATGQLALVSLLLALVLAFPIGVLSALRPHGLIGRFTAAFMVLAIGIPSFWLGILLVLLFALKLKWLPPSGYVSPFEDPDGWLRVIVLPSLTLALYLSAVLARFVRAAVQEVFGQDYVRTAKAKGIAARGVLIRHVLRNALIPIVTMIGIQAGGLLGGAVVVETIFAWPGIGRLLVTSIETRDYAIVQAIILLGASTFLVVNLLTDLIYGLLDPRIRTGG